jgi:bacteriocin biosynthesis cyclodehydratase domain-containing protein
VVLKLDPRFPLVWRSPSSLQFGVDAPPAVLPEVTNADERMIAALVGGVSRSGLSAIGTSAGAAEADVVRLLAAVTPALLPARPSARSDSRAGGSVADSSVADSSVAGSLVALSGTGPTAEGIATLLRANGIRVAVNEEATGPTIPDPAIPDAAIPNLAIPDLAIIVAQFVVEPELHGLWLRRDVPHLPVVFGDTAVRIGPLVEPGRGPCLHCLERERTDADPAWPAIASQLWGRSSPAETALAASETAALATRLALARLAPARPANAPSLDELLPAATSLHLDVDSGRISRRTWRPHPECACLALPGNDSAGADRGRNRWPQGSPRTGAAVAVPA